MKVGLGDLLADDPARARSVAHVGAGGHVEHLAGDVGGPVRGEEGHRLGDVGRAGQVTERPGGTRHLGQQLGVVLRELGVLDHAHGQVDRADPVRAALVGEPSGERGQAALGRRVRRLDAAAADVGRVAAHVHDHAAARVAHQRHRAVGTGTTGR